MPTADVPVPADRHPSELAAAIRDGIAAAQRAAEQDRAEIAAVLRHAAQDVSDATAGRCRLRPEPVVEPPKYPALVLDTPNGTRDIARLEAGESAGYPVVVAWPGRRRSCRSESALVAALADLLATARVGAILAPHLAAEPEPEPEPEEASNADLSL